MGFLDKYKQERILVHQGAGHNKFWAAYVDHQHTVHVRWGRLGTKGQSQEKSFRDEYSAASFVDSKYSEKARKGYAANDEEGREIDHARFEEMCIEAAIVGSANKCYGLQWVEIDNTKWTKIPRERLNEPDCEPGLLVRIETRARIRDTNRFCLLFTIDKIYNLQYSAGDANHGQLSEEQVITGNDRLAKFVQTIGEAVGRRFAG